MSRPQCPNHSCNLNLVGVAFARLLTTAALGIPLVAACSEKADPASTTDDAPEPSGDPTDAPSEGTDTPAPSGPVEPTGKLMGGFDLKFDAMTTSFSGTVYKTP